MSSLDTKYLLENILFVFLMFVFNFLFDAENKNFAIILFFLLMKF